jgi:alpha-tubulin suppressor-like RCC1 family protein
MTTQDWSAIAAGSVHTIALKTDPAGGGTLWAWGGNDYGQLGTNDTTSRNSPAQIIITTQDWAAIGAGRFFTVALKTDPAGAGTLWAWGQNVNGQLGTNDTTQRNSPTQIIMTTQDWSAIAVGLAHTIALKTDKTLWAWGANTYGRLGDGTTTQRTTPCLISSVSEWSMIAGGDSHTIALKADKTLWAWGYNYYGQLGDGTTTQRTTPCFINSVSEWSMIAGGKYYTIALKTGKTIWSWGYNYYGQLGLGDSGTGSSRNTPAQIGTNSDWTDIAAGESHTLGLKTNGTLWIWGKNDYGQLGLGDTINRNIPTLVSE